jgi:hypothetical protein
MMMRRCNKWFALSHVFTSCTSRHMVADFAPQILRPLLRQSRIMHDSMSALSPVSCVIQRVRHAWRCALAPACMMMRRCNEWLALLHVFTGCTSRHIVSSPLPCGPGDLTELKLRMIFVFLTTLCSSEMKLRTSF